VACTLSKDNFRGELKPFIVVADSAFPLSSTCMKCYEVGQLAYRRSFNYSLIRMRRVVEQAFGRLKGRWKIMDGKCSLKNPVFIRQVAMCVVPCTTCAKDTTSAHLSQAGFLSAYINTTPPNLQVTAVIGPASKVREALARYIHHTRPAPQ